MAKYLIAMGKKQLSERNRHGVHVRSLRSGPGGMRQNCEPSGFNAVEQVEGALYCKKCK